MPHRSDADGQAGHRLTVLGAGEVGAGWAALAAAQGRSITLYDPDAGALARGAAAVRYRVAALIDGGLAHPDAARLGLAALTAQPRLDAAVARADWIVEAAPESLDVKRELLAAAEDSSDRGSGAPVLASSSSGLHASALSTGLKRPDRMLVVHPLAPVELIPVVEVIPGPATAPEAVAMIRAELGALGRVPIVLRREVEGNAVGRIAAAVWRECIDLVLDDVLDVADLDRLAAEGPCLGWAAGGPHLTYDLAAGDAGTPAFLEHLLPTFEGWWRALSARSALTPEERARLAALVASAYDERRAELRAERDQRLVALVRALSETNARR
jgi:3-hydroxyacyl-CoA dehydrogenase